MELHLKIKIQFFNKREGGYSFPCFLKRMKMGVNKIYNIAFNDSDENVLNEKGELKPVFRHWYNMLSRCYCSKTQKRQPAYKGCVVCEEWLLFSNFKKWFDENYQKGYDLDKDILGNGKLYSPQTCCFVPHEINNLLCKQVRCRGEYPIGVCRVNNKYKAGLRFNGKTIGLGYFITPQEAFNTYKKAKEKLIKDLAKSYFENGIIIEKIYNALINYKINITD